MVSLVMLAIMAGCAAFLFFKGTLVQGVTMILNAVIAGFVAFGFFEMLARVLVKYSPGIAVWAPLICFALLFILAFAALQTGVMQLAKGKADLGKLPEQIGRPVCGLVLGYLITGHVLVAAAMAPLPSQYPYPRFDGRNPNPSKPNKPVLSPDGFVTGLFATVSKGSFSAITEPKSFGVLHAGYVDQLHLNRLKATQQVPLMTSIPAIDVPKKGVRQAPDSLRDSEGKPLSIGPGENLLLVRVEIKGGRALADAGKFTLSQIRLVCGPKGDGKAPLAGQGLAAYPIGYIGDKGRLERKSLDEIITVQSSGDAVNMDVAFPVPANLTPLLLEFKRNNVVQVSAPVAGEGSLEIVPFGTAPAASQAAPESQPPASGQPAPATPPPSNRKSRRGGATAEERVESLTGPLQQN